MFDFDFPLNFIVFCWLRKKIFDAIVGLLLFPACGLVGYDSRVNSAEAHWPPLSAGIQLRLEKHGFQLYRLCPLSSSSKGLRKDYVAYSSKLSFTKLSIKGKGEHLPPTVASFQDNIY